MKKYNIILTCFLFLLLVIPQNVFANAVCSASGIDASKWQYSETVEGSEREADGRFYTTDDLGKICCATGESSIQTTKYRCDLYTLANAPESTPTPSNSEENTTEIQENETREDMEDLRGDLDANCTEIFDQEAQDLIKRIFNIICIAVPILLIVLGSVDFGNAVLSSDQEAMQKAVKRFSTRCIVAVAIFFLPMIVNLVFSFPGLDIVAKDFFCDV